MAVGGSVPVLGAIPDAIDLVYTGIEVHFGKSSGTDFGLAAAGLGATFLPGVDQGIGIAKVTTRVAVREAAELVAKKSVTNATKAIENGGVYVLKNDDGIVMRTGRSNDMVRRKGEHARDEVLGKFNFEVKYRTDNKYEQRGLEHLLHKEYKPAFDKIRPVSPSNKKLPEYQKAAESYLIKLKEDIK